MSPSPSTQPGEGPGPPRRGAVCTAGRRRGADRSSWDIAGPCQGLGGRAAGAGDCGQEGRSWRRAERPASGSPPHAGSCSRPGGQQGVASGATASMAHGPPQTTEPEPGRPGARSLHEVLGDRTPGPPLSDVRAAIGSDHDRGARAPGQPHGSTNQTRAQMSRGPRDPQHPPHPCSGWHSGPPPLPHEPAPSSPGTPSQTPPPEGHAPAAPSHWGLAYSESRWPLLAHKPQPDRTPRPRTRTQGPHCTPRGPQVWGAEASRPTRSPGPKAAPSGSPGVAPEHDALQVEGVLDDASGGHADAQHILLRGQVARAGDAVHVRQVAVRGRRSVGPPPPASPAGPGVLGTRRDAAPRPAPGSEAQATLWGSRGRNGTGLRKPQDRLTGPPQDGLRRKGTREAAGLGVTLWK